MPPSLPARGSWLSLYVLQRKAICYEEIDHINYLDSEEGVPEVELDRLDVRDNLKLAAEADTPMKRVKLQQIQQLQQLEKFLTHWKAKVEDHVGIRAKKEVCACFYCYTIANCICSSISLQLYFV